MLRNSRRQARVLHSVLRISLASLGAAFALVCSSHALAFVSTPVGGHPGELDVNGQFTAERGKYEPNENQNSWLPVRDFYEYKLGVGYTWGDLGPLEFFSTRLEATYYQTPAERNDPGKWRVEDPAAVAPGTVAPTCGAGAKVVGDGVCEFYPEDKGAIVTGSVSFAAIHDPDFALGFFVRGSVPIGMDLKKFSNPRIDYVSFGSQVGVELKPWLSYESTIFFGLGTHPFSKEQNGAVALTNLFHFKAQRWLLPWKAGVKFGPYVEGDITERYDQRYDLAYSPTSLPQNGASSGQQTDRIRAARFALAFLPYFLVTEHLAVELGYIQKFFGYDARATQAYFAGLRGLFTLTD